jgi:hypothetical protein
LRAEFPRHNDGATLTVRREEVMPLLVEFLAERSADHLLAMFVVLWTVTRDEDDWLWRSDRSLFAFRRKLTELDRLARTRARAVHTATEDSSDPDRVWRAVRTWLSGRGMADAVMAAHVSPLVPMWSDRNQLVLRAPSQAFRDAIPEDVEQEIREGVRMCGGSRVVQFLWASNDAQEAIAR